MAEVVKVVLDLGCIPIRFARVNAPTRSNRAQTSIVRSAATSYDSLQVPKECCVPLCVRSAKSSRLQRRIVCTSVGFPLDPVTRRSLREAPVDRWAHALAA